MNILKFGIPKGSLEEATVNLFKQAGWSVGVSSRSYFPTIDDDEMKCSLIRPQEMGKYVQRGTIDVGIAGRDWVAENQADVVEVCEMVYSKVSRRPVRWVLVVAQAPFSPGLKSCIARRSSPTGTAVADCLTSDSINAAFQKCGTASGNGCGVIWLAISHSPKMLLS